MSLFLLVSAALLLVLTTVVAGISLLNFLKIYAPSHPLYIFLYAFSGLLSPGTHRGRPTPCAILATNLRYPGAKPPPNASNKHGEIEYLNDGVAVTHWFTEAAGVTWHYVTAGDPSREAVLIVHGLPESWWAFHHQISDLSRDHYVIAVDVKGYGQSDKRLSLDYTHTAIAGELACLMDKLEIDRFNLIGHDRGTVLTDHMTAVNTLEGRILRYIRMQQSFNEPHGEPVPPHAIFSSKFGECLFKSRYCVPFIYQGHFDSSLSESTMKRLDFEFAYEGIAEAMRKYFKTTNFDIELADRHKYLFKHMTMPMLILQGKYDVGQHPEEYENSHRFVADARVEFIEASHFLHLENPVAVNEAIRRFIEDVKVEPRVDTSMAAVEAESA